MTVLVANLDCEVAWSGAPPLPAPVRARIAALGTLMRALATSPDDVVLLPAPVDPVRIPDIPGLPRPEFHAGAAGGGTDRLAWGTENRAIGTRTNDRRLAAEVAGDGVARVVGSVAALEARLEEVVAESPGGAWVAKATICAAGRDRVRRRGAALDDGTRTRLARLLARGGALILEPWLERVEDLGQCGVVGDDGAVALVAPHRLICDPGGGFRGIEVRARDDAPLADAARRAGAAIAALGHRGPFGVDGFVHTGGLRALVEINARMTFGWIAHAWARRLGPGALAVGEGPPPAGAVPLLLPGADPTAAWWSRSRAA